jgi:hypothetical protein
MPASIKVICLLWVLAIVMIPIMRLINRIFYEEAGDWMTLIYAIYSLIVCIIFSRVVVYVVEVLS